MTSSVSKQLTKDRPLQIRAPLPTYPLFFWGPLLYRCVKLCSGVLTSEQVCPSFLQVCSYSLQLWYRCTTGIVQVLLSLTFRCCLFRRRSVTAWLQTAVSVAPPTCHMTLGSASRRSARAVPSDAVNLASRSSYCYATAWK